MIEFTYGRGELRKAERMLGRMKGEAPKALKNAVNQTAKQARAKLAKEAQKTYAVKNAGFNKEMHIARATVSRPEAVIRAHGGPVEMIRFSVRGGKGGRPVEVRIKKGSGWKALAPGTFVNNIADKRQRRKRDTEKGKKGSKVVHIAVAQRDGRERLHIHQMYSVAIPSMIGNEKQVYGIVKPGINQDLMKNIEKEVRRILEGA